VRDYPKKVAPDTKVPIRNFVQLNRSGERSRCFEADKQDQLIKTQTGDWPWRRRIGRRRQSRQIREAAYVEEHQSASAVVLQLDAARNLFGTEHIQLDSAAEQPNAEKRRA
jgi:hypothetical protein